MPEDLPIYSETMLRTRAQFADIERLKGNDLGAAWQKADSFLEQFEGGSRVQQAREEAQELSKATLLRMHSIVFGGALRHQPVQPLFRGQDCPDPQFVDRSLDNFFNWLSAESISQIHPIERAALVLTRIVDIWPFEKGNFTVAIMLSNIVLRDSQFAPFFVLPKHKKEFQTVIAQAVTIETQPLVNAIYSTVKREMEAIVER